MSFATVNFFLRFLTTLMQDFRFQVVFGFIVLAQWVTRLPRPRKRATNKSILITGCDSGMGHRMARRFDELGMHVFAGCLQPEGNGASILKETCSNRLHIVPLNITKEEHVKEAVNYVKAHLPDGEKGLYCLINNAGVFPYIDFDLTTWKMCEETIAINLTGTLRVTKQFLPLLSQSPGRIVAITSVVARVSGPRVAVYVATKYALHGFFSALRHEVEKKGIHVATIEPGNFTAITDIMQYTRRHMDDIWGNLPAEELKSRHELYERTKRSVNKPKISIEDQEKNYRILLADVEDAVLAEEPKWTYVSAPLDKKIIFGVMRNLPQSLSHKIAAKIMG